MALPPLPSFSRILLNPSAPYLPLPDAFVRKHLEEKIPENPILRSVNGGYSWGLKIKQVGGNYCFVNGWKEVVEDSQLGYGDFLVFWLVDPSTFKLSIFSPSGCERDFPVENDDVNQEDEEEAEKVDDKKEYEKEEEKEEEEEDDVNVDGDEGDPFFTKIMTNNRRDRFYLRFPLEFARLAGLDRERIVTMKNLEGKEWEMGLKLERHHYIRYYLAAGWSQFRQDNELLEGYECVFKFIKSQDKFCLAKVTKKKDWPENSTDKAPADRVLKRSRSGSRSKKPPAGKAPGVVVLKRPRGRPRRVKEDDDDGGDVNVGEDEGDPFFTKIITKSDTHSMRFPLEFAQLAGLDRERIVRMKNVEGKEWHMSLKLDRHHYIRYYLSAGWGKFRQDNELLEGYECVFKFIKSEDKLCLARVTKKRDLTKHPTDKAQVLKRRSGGRSTKRPAGKVRAVEVFKRPRGRPPRADMVEKKVVADGKAAAGEVLKRPRGRPPRVKVVEKNVRSNKSVGEVAPEAEIVKRKRGRPPCVDGVKKDDGANVVKRPRGRPFKKKRGRPSSVGVVKKDDDGAKVVKRPRGRPFKRKRGPAAHVK